MNKLSKYTFGALLLSMVTLPAFAEETVAHATGGAGADLGFPAAITIGIAALGGAIGQGLTASAAMTGISRNPGAQGKMFVPMIIGLALIESLVIYALVIAFQLVGKI